MKGATFAIQGFGNVGRHAAETASELGSKVVAVSDVSGAVYNPEGINVQELITYVSEHKTLKSYPGASSISNEQLLQMDVDVLCPCALDSVIHEGNFQNVRAKVIVEGANGPVTEDASQQLSERGVLIIPDVLANGGGVIVSYFEWVQDMAAFFWNAQEVDSRLREIITNAFETVWKYSQDNNLTMRMAAMAVSVKRLEKAMLLRGLYPR